MKIYCSGCGHPNSYASKKPNFCQNCGNSFGSSPKKPTTSTPREGDKETIEEEIGGETVPDITGLDVEIGDNRLQGMTLEQVVGMQAPNDGYERDPVKKGKAKGKRLSKKAQKAQADKFFEDFQKEAGTIKRSKKNE